MDCRALRSEARATRRRMAATPLPSTRRTLRPRAVKERDARTGSSSPSRGQRRTKRGAGRSQQESPNGACAVPPLHRGMGGRPAGPLPGESSMAGPPGHSCNLGQHDPGLGVPLIPALNRVGALVWAQLGSARRWPAVVVNASMCGQRPAEPGRLWVCWLAEYKISQVHQKKIWDFVLAFQTSLSRGGGKRYMAAVHEAIKEIAARSCTSPGADPLAWAQATFLADNMAMAAHTAGPVPMAVQAILVRKEAPAVPLVAPQQEEVHETGALEAVRKQQRRLEEVCVACDVVLPRGEEHQQHPLVEGGICAECREELLDTLFACSPDGTSAYCALCGSGSDLFICDNTSCSRCLCSHCLRRLVGENEPEKVSRCSLWQCHLCSGHSAGLLRPRPDWEPRVLEFFRPEHQCGGPAPDPMPHGQRRGLRVLSLFDGIATGKYVLDQLGILVEAYFASEVDKDAIHVGITQHGTTITYLGNVQALDAAQLERLCPIDLLIGGSPCNDISLVNPDRKGLYDPTGTGILFFEFYRVLRTLQLANGNRHLFWMFENVAAMPREYRRTISRFLQSLLYPFLPRCEIAPAQFSSQQPIFNV
ncbi:DNA (cytosine-5)-methyltransferase 3A-like isoform X2 [Amblyomma americanum]